MTIDSTGDVGQYTSLVVVNGNPAISYYDQTNQDLKFVRAVDASGTSWNTPIALDTSGALGTGTLHIAGDSEWEPGHLLL